MNDTVYVLGGYQTDFSRNAAREGVEVYDMLQEAVSAGLEAAQIPAEDIQSAHVGNFAGELFCKQGHLGGLVSSIEPAFDGLPTARHEAACASGSVALLAAAAEIEAGRYDLVMVVGAEIMRNVSGGESDTHLRTACWNGHELQEADFVWPGAFNKVVEEYDRRYGIQYAHLGAIAELNYRNARNNPNAQTRNWTFPYNAFTENDEVNPVVDGRIRRNDCGQLSDGAAVVFLANGRYAQRYLKRSGKTQAALAAIAGWGNRTSQMRIDDKLRASRDSPYVFPQLRGAVTDAYRRAGINGPEQLDAIETHDCFAISEYAAIEHFGITEPGEAWKAVEEGFIEPGGRIPVNPSGGLIGLGHPVGATGVRMMLDGYKQVTGTAGDYQVDGAKRVATLNIGGSATTVVAFVVDRCSNHA